MFCAEEDELKTQCNEIFLDFVRGPATDIDVALVRFKVERLMNKNIERVIARFKQAIQQAREAICKAEHEGDDRNDNKDGKNDGMTQQACRNTQDLLNLIWHHGCLWCPHLKIVTSESYDLSVL